MGQTYGGNPITNDGLILYMDAGSDRSFFPDTWKDLKGNYDGTVTNTTQSDGYYEFVYADVSTIIHDEIEFESSSNWSFSQWQYIETGASTWNAFCGTTQAVNGYWMWHSDRELFFYLDYYDDGGGYEYYGAVNWSITYPEDEWFNITITYDGQTSSATASLNGNQTIDSRIINWSPRPITSFKFKYIGAQATNRVFMGRMATFQVWDKKLSQTEIINNYKSLKHRFE